MSIEEQIIDILETADTNQEAADMIIQMLQAEDVLLPDQVEDDIDEDFLPPQTRDELEI